MRLRTTAGAYAGEIREYPYAAGMAALRSGTAERLTDETSTVPRDPAPRVTAPRTWRPIKKRK